MTGGPFRDDGEAAHQRADALEEELEREKVENERLRGLEEELAADNERLRAENARLRPSTEKPVAAARVRSERVDELPAAPPRPRPGWLSRAFEYVVDAFTSPGTDASFGQILVIWAVLGLAFGAVIGLLALISWMRS